MANKHVYYTFKVLTPNIPTSSLDYLIACHKWDEMEGSDELPVETYKIMPANKTAVGGCSCPAWKWDCKHVKCALEAIATGKHEEFHKWRWTEKSGWIAVSDLTVKSWEL